MNSLTALLLVVAACIVVGAPVGCTMHQNTLLAEAIAKSDDPIATRCAMTGSSKGNGSSETDPVCLAKVIKSQ